ncbi:hypothetical protein [Streptomyces sp. CC219B]|uniref:hypothetical protein n=1 Tax=Streptomyces sp. CC219B TaxID=3044574 RepID=UPI0024A8D270|nr:hypothetical protein [Streptomyces sp. CC219B]
MTAVERVRGTAAVRALSAPPDARLRPSGLAVGALLALCALLAALAAAPPARAAAETQAAYLADRLRSSPVYVTDQLPREIPKSTARDFARLAKGTGVPTYVLVLPGQAASGEGLLGAVHDRLGRDGLYVLLDESTIEAATAYGVTAPADDALTVSRYELPYDAGPLLSFERFVEAVAEGPEAAAARADAAREKYADDEPAELYIGPSDRQNQSLLTGMLLTGVPLFILLSAWYVRRWRQRLPGAPRKPAKRRPRWRLPAIAATAAALVALTTSAAFDQTTSSASPPPRAIDLNARLDRVAEGLSRDPVYTDPESPQVLDAAQLKQLHSRIRAFEASEGGGPVFVAVVPQLWADESQGDEESFAYALHDKVGKDGLYIVADPLDGYIDAFNYGLRLDAYTLLFDLPESIEYGDDKSRAAEDHLLGERLDALMTFLDKADRTDEPSTPGLPYPVDNPVTEDDLPPLFAADDFWPGLLMGTLAAGLLLGVVAGALEITGRVLRRRRPEPPATETLPEVSPTEPSESYLRTAARTELRALLADFDPAKPGDKRPGDCLDAAMLLLDGDADGIDDATPYTLLAVTLLARAGRAAAAGKAYNRCCAINPLHGPAVGRHHVRSTAGDRHRRQLHICARCRDTALTAPRTVHTLALTLPADGSGRRVPYEKADELLTAVPEGIRRLIEKVKERTHVP